MHLTYTNAMMLEMLSHLKMLLNILSKLFLNMSVKTSRNGLVVAKADLIADRHYSQRTLGPRGKIGDRHQFIISDSLISDGWTDGWTKKLSKI